MDDGASGLTFKVAAEPWELEQVHRLNYKTFVEEIPQHHANDQRALVDRFHAENVYIICLRGRELLGMTALRCCRPFSLDQKVPGLEGYLPNGWTKPVEIRLLATEREHRGGRVLVGLMEVAIAYLLRNGYDLALISGTTRQLKLYRHMGFVPFGPLVGIPGAMFQPMYITLARFNETVKRLPIRLADGAPRAVSFLPGPVEVSDAVKRAFAAPAESHRSERFLADLAQTQARLCELTNAPHVQVMTGSGTMANDVIAAQLSLAGCRGLILANGEFGERLIDHGRRWGLSFATVRRAWGESFDWPDVERAVTADPSVDWLWAVHCETSTGVLNDLAAIKALCARRDIRLCLDCISSLGTTPVDLGGVEFASAISGKGLRAFPGICLVFHAREIPLSARLPRYLDLGLYADRGGVPFTLASNLLYALKAAVEEFTPIERFAQVREHTRRVRDAFEAMGLTVLTTESSGSPAVLTVSLPPEIPASDVADAMGRAGYSIAYKSDYLLERNWVQVCLMGDLTSDVVTGMIQALRKSVHARSRIVG